MILRQLHPGAGPQKPYPQVREAQIHQIALCPLGSCQILLRNGHTGGDAGSQAGIGRLIPGEESGLPGLLPDHSLGQPCLPQRGADLKLLQRLHAGPVPGLVRGIGAIQQNGEAICPGRPPDIPKDILLAVVAAVGRVGRHLRVRQGVQPQHRHLGAKLLCQAHGILILKFRLEGRLHIVGMYLCPGLPGRIEQVGGVHSAGKGKSGFGIFLKKFIQGHCSVLAEKRLIS